MPGNFPEMRREHKDLSQHPLCRRMGLQNQAFLLQGEVTAFLVHVAQNEMRFHQS